MMLMLLLIPLVLVAWVVTAVSLKPTAPAVAGGVVVEARRPGIEALRECYVRGEIDRDEYQWRVLEMLTSR